MIVAVTVFEYASVHPSEVVFANQRNQGPPQFRVKQHGGITPIAAHCAAWRRGPRALGVQNGGVIQIP
jgi:hypothetical protein